MIRALLAYVAVVVLATGCAATQTMPAGVVLYDGDAERCSQQTCTLWTDEELTAFGHYLVDRVCRRGGSI